MGGMKAADLVAGPDDLIGDQANIGEGIGRVQRVGDDLVAPVLQTVIVPHIRVVRVGIIDVADVALFPDSVGDTDDIVDDVDKTVLEPAQRLPAQMVGPVRQERVRAAAAVFIERDREVGWHQGHVKPGRWLAHSDPRRRLRVPAVCDLVHRWFSACQSADAYICGTS